MPRHLAAFALLIVSVSGCQTVQPPGLGEIMSLQQMRHAKLWYAGEAGNWPLAAYEADELAEGFADVVRYHPRYGDAPRPLADLVAGLVNAPLREVRAAADAHDGARFARAYDDLTAGCNACHAAAGFGFNRVVRPTAGGYPNQAFAP